MVRLARLGILNSMHEKSKNKHEKEKYLQYIVRNKAFHTSQLGSTFEPPKKGWTRFPFPLNID